MTKTHRGDFARGGQGTYVITVSNTGDQPTSGTVGYIDEFPEGLVVRPEGPTVTSSPGVTASCLFNEEEINCGTEAPLPAGGSFTVEVTILVRTDAPCSVTNTVTVTDHVSGASATASDPTPVTGGECGDGGPPDGDGDGDGGSVLPVTISGVAPMFNNITTNNNIQSPDASNVSGETLRVDAE
ncbi:hypothetical protein AB0892_30725 [Streptomyces sp. NPDC005409]|uniref:hypothetical protein n=1 Tax=Streptomyces sp. NPDC005409 TaxID=3155342 RepID=UPI003454C540